MLCRFGNLPKHALFQQCCVEVNEPKLELLKWIRTRWASPFGMLERTLKLRKVSWFLLLSLCPILTQFDLLAGGE
jgi:hypothetical protein